MFNPRNKRGIEPKCICGLLWQSYVVNCYLLLHIFSLVLTITLKTLNFQGRQHPDRPGFKICAEERFPRRTQLLHCGPDRHPHIRREVPGQRGAGGCAAQRDGSGPVCSGHSLPQVRLIVEKIIVCILSALESLKGPL